VKHSISAQFTRVNLYVGDTFLVGVWPGWWGDESPGQLEFGLRRELTVEEKLNLVERGGAHGLVFCVVDSFQIAVDGSKDLLDCLRLAKRLEIVVYTFTQVRRSFSSACTLR
jgi:hypothetical protein